MGKKVRAYENRSRCYVRLFQKYRSLCEVPSLKNGDVFYFTPMSKYKDGQWFYSTPVGHNTLQNTVKRLCASAGIGGKKTNHSLRATAATRLYQADVDEQLICEHTGHRSDAVRVYKRSGDAQKAVVSDILCAKQTKLETTPTKLDMLSAKQTKPETTPTKPELGKDDDRCTSPKALPKDVCTLPAQATSQTSTVDVGARNISLTINFN